MKDEEMAEEYAKNLKARDFIAKPKEIVAYFAFLAGLKAGRPQWHKVADGDLPKDGIQVLSEKGDIVIYKGDSFCWFEYSPNADNIKLRKWEEPIAWCEIPTFDKE